MQKANKDKTYRQNMIKRNRPCPQQRTSRTPKCRCPASLATEHHLLLFVFFQLFQFLQISQFLMLFSQQFLTIFQKNYDHYPPNYAELVYLFSVNTRRTFMHHFLNCKSSLIGLSQIRLFQCRQIKLFVSFYLHSFNGLKNTQQTIQNILLDYIV